MNNYTHHICIVSDQRLANIIPILQLKPTHVELVVSESMKSISQQIVVFLKKYLPLITVREHIGLSTGDVDQMQETCLNLIMSLREENPTAKIIYNVTGGSKLMAIAFMAFANDFDDIIFILIQKIVVFFL